MFAVPEFLKQHVALVLVGAVGFLFAFYVENTYVTRAALASEQSALMQQLIAISQQIEMQAARDKHNLAVDGLQDAIAAAEDEMLELTTYLEEAPESSLTGARQRRIREMSAKKVKLERELTQLMAEPK